MKISSSKSKLLDCPYDIIKARIGFPSVPEGDFTDGIITHPL
jgi:hypothetical protein